MKTILATALIVALGIAGISLWGAVHARHMAVSSSQIFIHGTPVCVVEGAGEIRATVGMCGFHGTGPGEDGSAGYGEAPPPDEPSLALPPGHPPVGPDPGFDEGRRILI
ncbi:MAG: hypothetical protein ACM3OG_06020 [Actinomycetota bacterium]